MAELYNISVSQRIDTQEFEVTTTEKHNPGSRPYTCYYQSPCELALFVEDGGGYLRVAESGELGGDGFTNLDLEQAVTAFQALKWVVAAQQTLVEEDSDTVKALRRLGTDI